MHKLCEDCRGKQCRCIQCVYSCNQYPDYKYYCETSDKEKWVCDKYPCPLILADTEPYNRSMLR